MSWMNVASDRAPLTEGGAERLDLRELKEGQLVATESSWLTI